MPRIMTFQKHQLDAMDKPLVELYRTNKFVTDSMTTVHSHHTKVATSGAMSTESVKGFGSRHLTASPELPGLRERSSKSKNKFLYDLSVQLKDGEKRPTKRVYEFEQNQAKGYESDWSSSSLKSIKESPSVKSTTQKSLKKPKSPSAPAIRCIRRTPSFSAKSLQILARTRYPEPMPKNLAVEKSGNSSTHSVEKTPSDPQKSDALPAPEVFRYSDNPKVTLQAIIQRAKCSLAKKAQDKSKIDTNKPVEKDEAMKILRFWAREQMHSALQYIDDNHVYSLIILLGTLLYLVYILCFDVSEYLNQERQHLVTIENSGLAMKCCHYLVQLLNG